MSMRFVSPKGVREQYRSVSLNIVIAGVVGLYTTGVAVNAWQSTADQATFVSRWSLLVIVIGAAIVIVRALRRGVFVTDVMLIERRQFVTRVLPWSSLNDVSFPSGGNSLRAKVEGKVMSMRVRPKRMRTPFDVAVQAAMANAKATRTDRARRPYPARGRRWITLALLASYTTLLIGVLVVDQAVRDRDVYRLRAARDVSGLAEVAGSHVDEGGQDSPTYTYVDIRFPVGERTVRARLHRRGRWKYEIESQIPIVYDARHPATRISATGPIERPTTPA